MNKNLLFTLFLVGTVLLSSCGSKDDECTKTAEIPHYALKNKKFERYVVMEEVSCDFINFTPDTGNETSRLKFEIKLNNPNNYAVEGLANITVRAAGDDFEYTGTYSDLASVPCYKISANSSCILTYDVESPYNPNVGAPKSMEVVNVVYYIAN